MSEIETRKAYSCNVDVGIQASEIYTWRDVKVNRDEEPNKALKCAKAKAANVSLVFITWMQVKECMTERETSHAVANVFNVSHLVMLGRPLPQAILCGFVPSVLAPIFLFFSSVFVFLFLTSQYLALLMSSLSCMQQDSLFSNSHFILLK